MSTPITLINRKGSLSYNPTENTNNSNPISLPSLESGQVTTAAGNTGSNIQTGGIVGNNAGGVLNITDGGAFELVGDSVTKILDLTAEVFKAGTNQANSAVQFAGTQAQAAVTKATEQTNSNAALIKNLMLFGGGLAALYVAFRVWGK